MVEARIVLVLDSTGSMKSEPRYSNTITGYNTWLAEMQKELPEAAFSLIMFNSFSTDIAHRNARLSDVPELTSERYVCDGWTPLFEAICKAIEAAEKASSPDEKVIIAIITDGEENCSPQPFTLSYVAKRVKEKQNLGWQFIFLGANMDAWKASAGTAIPQRSTMSYDANDKEAVLSTCVATARGMASFASGQTRSMEFSADDLDAAGSDKFAQRPDSEKSPDKKTEPKGTVEIDL